MKRLGGFFPAVADFENLYRAFRRASRGKLHRPAVAAFSLELDRELLRLRDELRAGTYQPGPYRTFTIRDPKPRLIAAAPFRDRVVHHAIVGVLEPWFSRWLDAHSFACRRLLGVDAALAHAQAQSRASAWVLRSDIRRCYPSIPHAPVKDLLRRKLKDKPLLALLDRIVDHGGQEGRGMPIGSLTSQWLANLYLGEIDRYVRHTVRPQAYLRYMDDFALFSSDKPLLLEARFTLGYWVREALGLELNPKVTALYPTAAGWPCLGFRVFPGRLQLRRSTWKRFRRRLGELHHAERRGCMEQAEKARRAECMLAHLHRARSLGLRRREARLARE